MHLISKRQKINLFIDQLQKNKSKNQSLMTRLIIDQNDL